MSFMVSGEGGHTVTTQPDLQTYAAEADAWLAGNATPRRGATGP